MLPLRLSVMSATSGLDIDTEIFGALDGDVSHVTRY